MEITLFEPEIAGNVGSALRMAACLNLKINLIEPLGFVFGGPKMRRVGMDYLDRAEVVRFTSFTDYLGQTSGRKILLTGDGKETLADFVFASDDHLVVGRESSGVPWDVAAQCDYGLRIPMQPGLRSFNASVALALVVGAFLRANP